MATCLWGLVFIGLYFTGTYIFLGKKFKGFGVLWENFVYGMGHLGQYEWKCGWILVTCVDSQERNVAK